MSAAVANDPPDPNAWRLPTAARVRISAAHMRAMALRAAETGSPQVTQSALRISNKMLAGLRPRVVSPC